MTQNLGFAFQQLAFSLLQDSDNALNSQLGIGYAQYKLLEVLAEFPHSSQRFIAAQLKQSEASVSRQIKLMKNKGLLRVGTPPENKRTRVIALSTKGSEVHTKGATILNHQYEQLFGRLSPEDQHNFYQVVQKLTW